MDTTRFFWNNVNVDKWIRRRLFAKLRKIVDPEKFVNKSSLLVHYYRETLYKVFFLEHGKMSFLN